MKDDLRQQNKPPAASREQGTEEATCGYLFLVEFGGRNGLCCPCCRLPAGARRTVPPPDVERAHRRGIPAPFASLRAQIVDEPARARDTRQLPKRTGAYHGQLPRRAIRRAHRRHQLQPGRRRARQPAEPAVRPRVRRPLRHRRHVGRPAVRPHEPHGPRHRALAADAVIGARHVPLQAQARQRRRLPSPRGGHGRARYHDDVLHRRQRLHGHRGRAGRVGARQRAGQAVHRHSQDRGQRPGARGPLPRIPQRRKGGLRDHARHTPRLRCLHAPRGVRARGDGPRCRLARRELLRHRRRGFARVAGGGLRPRGILGRGAEEVRRDGQVLTSSRPRARITRTGPTSPPAKRPTTGSRTPCWVGPRPPSSR